MKPSVLLVLAAVFAAGCNCAAAKVGSAEAAACGQQNPGPCGTDEGWSKCAAQQAPAATAIPAVIVAADGGVLDAGDDPDDDGGTSDGGDDAGTDEDGGDP